MWEVLSTFEFEEWFLGQDDEAATSVHRAVGLLRNFGPSLGHPHSSAILGASFALRELRVRSSRRPLRVLYAFDPMRRAVLLTGGDKTGDDRFYVRIVPLAEKIWRIYLEQIA